MSETVMPVSGAKTFSENREEDLIKQGEYEVTLELAEPKLFGENQDKPACSCKFRIRRDVDQPGAGRVISDTMWLDKDTENWEGWYDHKKLHAIILTQPKPKLDFKNCDECVQYINGLNMRITINERFDEYRGKKVNEVAYLSYKPSAVDSAATPAPQVTADDLPF